VEDRREQIDDPIDEGGDPACWAARVCAECGRLNEARDPEICEACGTPFEQL
jgi:hypothetical protein